MRFNRNSMQILVLTLVILLTSCQPALPTPEPRIETPALPVESTTDASELQNGNLQSETASYQIPVLPPISADSPFCEVEEGSLLIPSCENGELAISRTEDPRRMNVFLNRDVDSPADAVFIQAEVTSIPLEGLKLDQNQYGLYIIDQDGIYRAIRISGQYFNFETWSLGEDLEIESRHNRVFTSHRRS